MPKKLQVATMQYFIGHAESEPFIKNKATQFE